MSQIGYLSAVVCMALMTLSCQRAGELAPITPDPDALTPFTTALRDAQPPDAFFAVYAVNDRHLIFQGARHSVRTDSQTFRLIYESYEHFDIDTVIVEGCPYNWGPDPERLLDYVSERVAQDGFQEGGETVPAVRGAERVGATVFCGEADDAQIRRRVLAAGFSDEDLLGFYTLRSIPQWMREERVSGADDPAVMTLIEADLRRNRERLGLEDTLFPDFEAWRRWYEATNLKAFGSDFQLAETGPLADGVYGSNAVAAAISRARAAFLQERVADHLNAGESLMVVYGLSHLMIHRAALDRMLGSPCYVGETMADAARACS